MIVSYLVKLEIVELQYSHRNTEYWLKMNQNLLNNHYKKVADRYDESFSAKNFTGYSFMGEAGARTIIDMMNIRKDDRVVDLGSGTCVTAGSAKEIIFVYFM